MMQIHRSPRESGGPSQDPQRPSQSTNIDPVIHDVSSGRQISAHPPQAELSQTTKIKDAHKIHDMLKGGASYGFGLGIAIASFGLTVGVHGAIWGGIAWGASSFLKIGSPTTIGWVAAAIGGTLSGINFFVALSEHRDGSA